MLKMFHGNFDFEDGRKQMLEIRRFDNFEMRHKDRCEGDKTLVAASTIMEVDAEEEAPVVEILSVEAVVELLLVQNKCLYRTTINQVAQLHCEFCQSFNSKSKAQDLTVPPSVKT